MHTKHCGTRNAMVRLLLVFTSIFSLSAWATPDKDPFYHAAPLPGGASGDVIDFRPSVFTPNPFSKKSASSNKAWQVIYQSENATGKSIAVSGTVLVPTKPWPVGERPIIGYSVGSRGLSDSCAPSYTLSKGIDYEVDVIADLLKKGWAVAISDYEGLGTPGLHTYMVGQSQGRVALDMVRAAQRLSESGLSAHAPVGLMGYSQGGGAVGWASQLASSYAPELNIVAAAMGGVPANLDATGKFADGTMFAGFPLMAAAGLDAAYDDLNLESFLNEDGLKLLADADKLCLLNINGFARMSDSAFTNIVDFVTTSPFADPAWQFRMAEQELGRIAPKMPVFLYHGRHDQIVPFAPAAKLRQDWCGMGASVEWKINELGDSRSREYFPIADAHFITYATTTPSAIDWVAARFAGVPSWGNCSLTSKDSPNPTSPWSRLIDWGR